MTRSVLSFMLILTVLAAGCAPYSLPLPHLDNPTPSTVAKPQSLATLTPGPAQPTSTNDFIGRVVDMDGGPIQGAHVEALNNSAVSDKDGWFRFSGDGLPHWIKVTATGFISRTRAASPAIPVLFRLTPDDGKTTVLLFAGDTMFGRRFFDPNEDDYTADGLLPVQPTVDDHLRLLAPIKPLLESADLTVLNFETTLADQAFIPSSQPRPAAYHATAGYVYASNPNSVLALKQSGVDIVDIGNNHGYDMLEPGLNTTLSTLDQAGVLHFGAGTNEANAWAPVIVSSKGQKIAFIGCTTLRIPLQTPIPNDIPFVASDLLRKGGAAYCTEARLRSEVARAKQQADVVVVMIHGGKEYDPHPTYKISYLTSIAKAAGASLVIDHQPHVVGGFSWRDQALTAWTMGSFITDQMIWPALQSYVLAVYVREGKVIRAYAEPLVVDEFLPHGITNELADYVVRSAAGLDPGPFVMENGAMEVDLNGSALDKSYTQTIDGGSTPGTIVRVPSSQWISSFKGKGTLRLGRDLLWVGSFENDEVDSASGGPPLWDPSMGTLQAGPDYAYEGKIGIRLERGARNTSDAVTTNAHRVLVSGYANLSITGMVRADEKGTTFLQISWYSAASGPSFSKIIQPIEVQPDNGWQSFRFDIQVPRNAVALGLFLRLASPVRGTVGADFDNIRIIEWASQSAPFSPLYNYALLTGAGELTLTQQIFPGAEQWLNTQPTIETIR